MTNWVSYYFFGPRPLTDIEELHNLEITAASECHNKVLFGTAQGEIWVAMTPGAPAQKTDLVFQSKILHIVSATYSQRVLIVYKDENTNSFVFQVYNSSDFTGLYEIVVPDPVGVADISFLTCSPKMSKIAFTIDRKNILLYAFPASDKAYERIQRVTTPPEVKMVDATISGLFLANDSTLQKYIYVLCTNSIICYNFSSKGSLKHCFSEADPYNPEKGEELACLGPKGRLYICQGKTVSVYSNDENMKKDVSHKIKEIVLDGHPQKIYWFRQYLVCTFPEEMNKMKIYEPSTHCIFGALPYGDNVHFFLNEWSGLTLVQEGGEIIVLEEPSTEQKIQKLCTRFNQFDVALKLAKKQKLPPTVIATIHRTKGDKAFTRKNFDEAVSEYILTIGALEPSYVIKKFLDPQHASLLIRYLEELQKAESSTASSSARSLHSTLLFNCYCKLRRENVIQEKVDSAAQCAASGEEPPFDVDAAIDVLNHSGYTEYARGLAKAFGKHGTYMKILYDAGEPLELFKHFAELGSADLAGSAICEYGGWILANASKEEQRMEFANFVVGICTKGVAEVNKNSKNNNNNNNNGSNVNISGNNNVRYCDPEDFETIFALYPKVYNHFLAELCAIDAKKLTTSLWNDFVETTITTDLKSLNKVMNHPLANYSTEQVLIMLQEPAVMLKDLKRKYDEARKSNKVDDPNLKIDINEVIGPLGYINAALITLYNKRQVYTEILEVLPPEKIPNACETYGENDPNFWLEGLREAERRNKGPIIKEIVKRIHEKKVFPVNSLLKPKVAFSEFTFDVFADIIFDDFDEMQKQIEAKELELKQLDEQLQKDKKVVQQLTSQYYTIKPVNCAYCKLPVDRPSCHFLCGHAFHKACLDGGAHVCRVCKEAHIENSKAKIKQLEEAKNEKDILLKIKESKDPQEALNALLEGGFFAPELEMGGEEAVNELSARLQPPPEQVKCD